ncbi:Core-2/I-Branching enzyme [Pedobacter nyackensis]|uniref:Peptide O-xylosyltransferase n=2 Tax=Pedobacter nyackensis TaxID=475255 RepID=A0A1W2DFL5_9SPHI|nr:Core-2/I-Branching enzyme [Pedobacter nyackensis]
MQYPDFDFYIHIDQKIDIGPFLFLKDIASVFFIQKRIECNWGGYSTLQAMVNSLQEAHESSRVYKFYNLLSAQDYPLRSNKWIHDFLLENAEKSFIYYEEDHTSKWWDSAVQRFDKYHLTDFNFPYKFFVERIINKVLPKRKFPLPVKLYGGSKASWWMINDECAEYLLNAFKKEKGLSNFLRFCWGTDEFVIPTILMNSPLSAKIVNGNLRYIFFPKGDASPKILQAADLDAVVKSDMLFARKFDAAIDSVILDEIDEFIDRA